MSLPDDADVSLLPNLGEKSARVLRSVGVRTVGDLRTLGPIDAYLRARIMHERTSINLLWALVAGLRGESWTRLDPAEKEALRSELRKAG